jgi:ATP-dependent DNA ligase
VSHLPYHERRRLLESVIDEIRPFNKNWHTVEAMKPGQDPTEFYNRIINDPRGLPWSEGIVVKNRFAPEGELWTKIKRHDLLDLEILPDGFAEGHGKYAGTLGALTVMDPKTGSIGEVGSGFSDYERDWIWQHQDSLNGAVIKVKVMEETGKSFRAPVFHSFHEGKGNTEAGLIMYAESLAGLDPEEIMRTKYKLISSAGWKR